MFASASQSSKQAIPAYVRARAEVRGVFERAGPSTRLIDNFETGGLRLRLPNAVDGCEAVILNTAGGLAGGDESHLSFAVGRRANVRLTTQSAEKIYRADTSPAVIAAELEVGEDAKVVWMPQETILFDGSKLNRSLAIEMAASASVMAVECTVFGRVARGERLQSGSFRDRWRVRRNGSLVFADDVRLDGDISSVLRKAATGNSALAIATLVCLSPKAEKALQSVRTIIGTHTVEGGVSAWNSMLVARLASPDPLSIRNAVADILRRLSKAALPKVWSI